jgi:hypothetical protein
MRQDRSFESHPRLAGNKIPEDRTSIFGHCSIYSFDLENTVLP